jgi:hypothetical protein
MNVEEIRTRIKDTYKSLSSYQDSGVIRRSHMVMEVNGWFKTHYLKPNQLLFEWSEFGAGDENVLMIKDDKAQLIHKGMPEKMKVTKSMQDIEKVMTVNMPMSMAAGATSGMSDKVLPLLIDKSQRPCFIAKKLARLRDQVIDGESCFQLREIYEPSIVWVSQNDFTVRRCESDGFPILNDIFRPTMKAIVYLSKLFSPKSNLPSHVDDRMTADWLFQNVQYNHLDESSFPKFEFER